jgi:hypothetical protein
MGGLGGDAGNAKVVVPRMSWTGIGERKKTEGYFFYWSRDEDRGEAVLEKCIGDRGFGEHVGAKTIQGRTEFTGSIGIRGSVRSVQSSRVCPKKKISIGFVLSCRLLQ